MRPARRRSIPPLLRLLALTAVALFSAACIGGNEVAPSATIRTAAPPPTAGSVAPPSPEATQSTDSPVPTETPTETPSDDSTAAPSGATGSVEVCAGNDDNRDFYAKVAADMDWPVYCPVLPSGWFVTAGTYRSAGGGWMEIAYRGPGGARLELSEGSFCDTIDGCVPSGEGAGPAAFGDQAGSLVTGDDGSLSIVVDQGQKPSWLATGTGLDVEAFRSIAAGLNRLD